MARVTAMTNGELAAVINNEVTYSSDENDEPSIDLDKIFDVCAGKNASDWDKVHKTSVAVARLCYNGHLDLDMSRVLMHVIKCYAEDYEEERCKKPVSNNLEPVEPESLATHVNRHGRVDKDLVSSLFKRYEDKYDKPQDVAWALIIGILSASEEGLLGVEASLLLKQVSEHYSEINSLSKERCLDADPMFSIYWVLEDADYLDEKYIECYLRDELKKILDEHANKEVQDGPEDNNGDGAVE